MSRSGDGIIRQRYLEEIIRKERDSMVGRYLVRRRREEEREDEDEEGADGTKSRQYEVFRKRLELQRLQPSAAQLLMREKLQRPHEKTTAAPPGECTGTRNEVFRRLPPLDMNPVDDATRTRLYLGGQGRDGGGRRSYLRTRNGLGPDQKYRYPVLTSWDYGWKLDEVVKTEELKSPPHGRTRIVNDTFYSRNGVMELSHSVS